jgi:hypothetical protein
MVLSLPISADAGAKLTAKAAAAGLDVVTYAARPLKRIASRPTLDEVLAPLRSEFERSGLSDDDLTDLLKEAKHEAASPRSVVTGSRPTSVIFDCNADLQAMLSVAGPAHACWKLVLEDDVTLPVKPIQRIGHRWGTDNHR